MNEVEKRLRTMIDDLGPYANSRMIEGILAILTEAADEIARLESTPTPTKTGA